MQCIDSPEKRFIERILVTSYTENQVLLGAPWLFHHHLKLRPDSPVAYYHHIKHPLGGPLRFIRTLETIEWSSSFEFFLCFFFSVSNYLWDRELESKNNVFAVVFMAVYFCAIMYSVIVMTIQEWCSGNFIDYDRSCAEKPLIVHKLVTSDLKWRNILLQERREEARSIVVSRQQRKWRSCYFWNKFFEDVFAVVPRYRLTGNPRSSARTWRWLTYFGLGGISLANSGFRSEIGYRQVCRQSINSETMCSVCWWRRRKMWPQFDR